MLNKLAAFIREEELIGKGDTVIVAVSGGADSVALLFAMYLLKEKLGISLEAAHFDHQLRGEASREAGSARGAGVEAYPRDRRGQDTAWPGW